MSHKFERRSAQRYMYFVLDAPAGHWEGQKGFPYILASATLHFNALFEAIPDRLWVLSCRLSLLLGLFFSLPCCYPSTSLLQWNFVSFHPFHLFPSIFMIPDYFWLPSLIQSPPFRGFTQLPRLPDFSNQAVFHSCACIGSAGTKCWPMMPCVQSSTSNARSWWSSTFSKMLLKNQYIWVAVDTILYNLAGDRAMAPIILIFKIIRRGSSGVSLVRCAGSIGITGWPMMLSIQSFASTANRRSLSTFWHPPPFDISITAYHDSLGIHPAFDPTLWTLLDSCDVSSRRTAAKNG